MSAKQHSKTVLAGDAGCRVVYCAECGVAEIEVGSVSLRLKQDDFRNLRRLIDDAADSLDAAEPSYFTEVRHVH